MARNYNIPYIFYTFFWASEIKNHLPSQNLDLSRAAGQWICQALPLAPPRGMNPGVYSLGISEDPPRYLSSKFDASVRSDCWDISIWKTLTQCDGNGNGNANADDWGDYNSSPCTSYRRAKKIGTLLLLNNRLRKVYKNFQRGINLQIFGAL